MKLLIITHANHGFRRNYFSYGPYVREMNIWTKFADEVSVVANVGKYAKSEIDLDYTHPRLKIRKIATINFQSFSRIIRSFYYLPSIFFKIFIEMKSADHIHLRCPGNIGLIGCIVQIFFPSKSKSAKYAGNWDPTSSQPLSYKIQKWILSNDFLTRNIKVLVYGDWKDKSKNIKPFFTATYREVDKIPLFPKKFDRQISLLFVGSLSDGKRPLYSLKLAEKLHRNGFNVKIDFYGEGHERATLEKYIINNELSQIATLYGNQNQVEVRKAYQNSHFLILPSKSEGWPKVVAEAMFWGVVPIVTSISCTPNMLDFGSRGLLLNLNLNDDIDQISSLIRDGSRYVEMSTKASIWSREFTLDKFENEIELIISK
ncbi:MAG: glycosyltransferase family 4 protein [Flavobacterium sp.]